jgi:hypothetical protein
METKICPKCKKDKPFSEFHKNKRLKYGIQVQCKKCVNEFHKSFYAQNRLKNNKKDYSKEEFIKCPSCKEIKSSFLFDKTRSFKNGYSRLCKSCGLSRDRKHRYGVTSDVLCDLIKKQNGKCAICNSEFSRNFCVDHDHKSKTVRGLLCFGCNFILGVAKDNPAILHSAALYLERSKT